jgi:hypothetical protein
MAWPKGKQTQSQIPVCFFAEAHNPATRNCSEEDITSCCMLGCAQPLSGHVGMLFFLISDPFSPYTLLKVERQLTT